MKRFLIETSVENAEGSQTWYVDATSEDEALKKYEQGRCDLYASNVDVTSLGEPEISGETTLDDFGDFAEQPAQQEPVGYVYSESGVKNAAIQRDVPNGTPLYTSQAQRKPLTDKEITAISKHVAEGGPNDSVDRFVRAIEAAHGIKE